MPYLIRDNKVEYEGTKKQIIVYIKQAYEDDYWVQEYWDQLDKDYGRLKFVLENLGLCLKNKK